MRFEGSLTFDLFKIVSSYQSSFLTKVTDDTVAFSFSNSKRIVSKVVIFWMAFISCRSFRVGLLRIILFDICREDERPSDSWHLKAFIWCFLPKVCLLWRQTLPEESPVNFSLSFSFSLKLQWGHHFENQFLALYVWCVFLCIKNSNRSGWNLSRNKQCQWRHPRKQWNQLHWFLP